MEVVYQRCCGIDVHKKMIVACFRDGRKKEIREFGTLTGELRELTEWLLKNGCEMIAMESTASYWKPLYNLFELSGLPAMVVNAQHMKTLPGRKTDVKDAEWIADLLQHGLLKASFIPDREQRELREVSRYRKSLVEERSRELNRLQKMLEGANIKLSSKLTHINGKGGRQFLDLLLSGEDISLESVDDIRNKNMHSSAEEILNSLDGIVSELQKKLLRSVLDHIDDMTRRIKDVDKIIKDYIKDYEDAIKAVDEIPGVGKIGAQTILSEIGKDMSRFPTAAHLCKWAGVAP
ncbi:MAG: IS110 family transposase, partial [Acutalibacteraceae bacterium]